jgi:hypothetical protein
MEAETVLFLREQVASLHGMLKEAIAELRKARPTAAAEFKKKHHDFSTKLIERT